jgi:hypothetical protein
MPEPLDVRGGEQGKISLRAREPFKPRPNRKVTSVTNYDLAHMLLVRSAMRSVARPTPVWKPANGWRSTGTFYRHTSVR